MEKIDELKELKNLLDEDIITDEEFRLQKSKLLGIDNSYQIDHSEENAVSIDGERSVEQILQDYEKKLITEDKVNRDTDELQSNELTAINEENPERSANFDEGDSKTEENIVSRMVQDHDQNASFSNKEISNQTLSNSDFFDKEKIKHLAKLKAEEEIKDQKRAKNFSALNKGMSKCARVLKWILAVLLWVFGVLSLIVEKSVAIKFASLILIIEGCLACPKITELIRLKEPVFTKYKTIFVILGVVLFFVICLYA